ncbi:MAG: NAD-dependent epimerase/dehydratase family protein [Myxococcales bacterium]|nr:NAD-dependent epimerase/dehydratase family protein [Myxococcales bacterium]
MRTLVTGAGGFIGSAVVRALLARGRSVRATLAPGEGADNLAGLDVEQVVVDVRDQAAVAAAVRGCDVVYHLAAIYSLWLPDPARIFEVNVEGTKNVLGAAAKAGVQRIVHTSSIAAIGVPAPGQLADERFTWNHWRGGDAYIRSKYLSDQDAQRFARDGAPVVIVCPAFPFGERDRGPTPTGRFIAEALAGRVPGYTDGGFCAVDVDDVAACHVLAEERGRIGERYIAGSHNVTYREFYGAVARIAGLRPIRRTLPGAAVVAGAWLLERWAERGGPPPRVTVKAARYALATVWYDCDKARRELGMPRTPLDATIAKAVAWFRAHPGP